MKIEITRELKIKLLQAIKDGVFDTDQFPKLAIINWQETKTYVKPKE